MDESLFRQLDQRILDMQLEAVQCLLSALKRGELKSDVRERIEESARRFHGLAAFVETEPVQAFAALAQLDASSPHFRALAEPFMKSIRGTRYLMPSAIAQEFLAALPPDCWNE